MLHHGRRESGDGGWGVRKKGMSLSVRSRLRRTHINRTVATPTHGPQTQQIHPLRVSNLISSFQSLDGRIKCERKS